MVSINIDLKSIGFQKRIHPLALVTFPIMTMKQWCQWMFIKSKGKTTLEIMNGLLSKMNLAVQKKARKNIQDAIKKYRNKKDKEAETKQLEVDLKQAQQTIGVYFLYNIKRP